MGSEWLATTISSFCPFTYGKGLPAKKRNPDGYFLVYGSNGPVGTHDQPLVDEPGIVIGRKGTVGSVHFVPKPFWPIDTTFYVVSAPGRHLKYTYYLLKSIGLREMNADSAVPGLNRDAAHAKAIAVPPLPEQRAIAHILGSLDDKIESNRQMNKTLESMARAIFKSWFVDFDPVRAKAEGRPTGLPDDISALFPDSFQDPELGKIPKGWASGIVSDLGKVICGKTPPTKDPENYGEDIPFITIPDMHGNIFVTQTSKYLSTKGANSQCAKYLPAYSICVSCIATPGLVIITTDLSQTNQQINSVIPKNEQSFYYCYQVLNKLGDQIRTSGSGGSVLLNLNKTLFSNIKITMPDRNAIESYQGVVEPFFKLVLQNQRESTFLVLLRDTLLPKLISGELRVPEAEKFVEEAVQ